MDRKYGRGRRRGWRDYNNRPRDFSEDRHAWASHPGHTSMYDAHLDRRADSRGCENPLQSASVPHERTTYVTDYPQNMVFEGEQSQQYHYCPGLRPDQFFEPQRDSFSLHIYNQPEKMDERPWSSWEEEIRHQSEGIEPQDICSEFNHKVRLMHKIIKVAHHIKNLEHNNLPSMIGKLSQQLAELQLPFLPSDRTTDLIVSEANNWEKNIKKILLEHYEDTLAKAVLALPQLTQHNWQEPFEVAKSWAIRGLRRHLRDETWQRTRVLLEALANEDGEERPPEAPPHNLTDEEERAENFQVLAGPDSEIREGNPSTELREKEIKDPSIQSRSKRRAQRRKDYILKTISSQKYCTPELFSPESQKETTSSQHQVDRDEGLGVPLSPSEVTPSLPTENKAEALIEEGIGVHPPGELDTLVPQPTSTGLGARPKASLRRSMLQMTGTFSLRAKAKKSP